MPIRGTADQCAAVERITKHLPAIYVVVALLVSIPLCLLTPPFFVPDEVAHSSRAIEIGHGEWITHKRPQGVGAEIDANALHVMTAMQSIQGSMVDRYPVAHTRPDGRITEAQLALARKIRWARHTVFFAFQNTAVYPPILYIPQAIGWRLGEAFNLTILHSLLLARLFVAFSATAIGWLAMRLCVSGQWLLFAYLLLPTKLSLNASCSQDGLLLAVAGLIMALLSRPICFRRLFTASELVASTALIAICVAARPPYLPLVFLLLLPSLELRAIRRREMFLPIFAILVALGVFGGWETMVHSLGNMVGPGANPAQQVNFLRSHPIAGALNLLEGTVREVPQLIVRSVEILGANDVFAPAAIYALLFISVAGIGLLGCIKGLSSRRSKVSLVLALVAVIAGISLAEYIIWNSPGSHRVEGLQSRYYLPIVPLVFFLFSREWQEKDNVAGMRAIALGARRKESLLVAAGLIFVAAVLYTPWIAAHSFYKLGLGEAAHLALK